MMMYAKPELSHNPALLLDAGKKTSRPHAVGLFWIRLWDTRS